MFFKSKLKKKIEECVYLINHLSERMDDKEDNLRDESASLESFCMTYPVRRGYFNDEEAEKLAKEGFRLVHTTKRGMKTFAKKPMNQP